MFNSVGRDALGRNFGRVRLIQIRTPLGPINMVLSPDFSCIIPTMLVTIIPFYAASVVGGHHALTRWSSDGSHVTLMGEVDYMATCLAVVAAVIVSIMVAVGDPGYVPIVDKKQTNSNNNNNNNQKINVGGGDDDAVANGTDHLLKSAGDNLPPSLRDWPLLGKVDPYASHHRDFKECTRGCNLRRPPRMAHCALCACEVLEHDHHCFFLSKCIGIRNSRLFIAYLSLISLAAVNVFTWIWARLRAEDDAPFYYKWTVALEVFVGWVALAVGAICVLQLQLLFANETRRESQQGIHGDDHEMTKLTSATADNKKPGSICYYHEGLLNSQYSALVGGSNGGGMWGNVKRIFLNVPPSLIVFPGDRLVETMTADAAPSSVVTV